MARVHALTFWGATLSGLLLSAAGQPPSTIRLQNNATCLRDLVNSMQLKLGAIGLIVVDTASTPLSEGFRRLLQQKDLPAKSFSLFPTTAASELARELYRELSQTADTPVWCFVEANGRIHPGGSTLPGYEAFLRRFEETGIKTRREKLQDFHRAQPENMDIQTVLLMAQRMQGERETSALIPDAAPPGAASATPWKEAPSSAVLSPEEDERIWGAYARQLEQALPDYLAFRSDLSRVLPKRTKHSPVLRELLKRWRPRFEAALRREPSSHDLWMSWFACDPVLQGRSLTEMLQDLVPAPTAPTWPPLFVISTYLEHCKTHRAWAALKDIAEPRWSEMSQRRSPSSRTQHTWVELVEPLLLAYLCMDELSLADQRVSQWRQQEGWDGALPRAATLARETGNHALAAKWGSLHR